MRQLVEIDVVNAIKNNMVVATLKTTFGLNREEIERFAKENPAELYKTEKEFRLSNDTGLVINY